MKDIEAFCDKHGCVIETDNYGQIIIYTGMMFDENDNVIPFRHEDEEENN